VGKKKKQSTTRCEETRKLRMAAITTSDSSNKSSLFTLPMVQAVLSGFVLPPALARVGLGARYIAKCRYHCNCQQRLLRPVPRRVRNFPANQI